MKKIKLKELLRQFKEEDIIVGLDIPAFQEDYQTIVDKKTSVFIQIFMFLAASFAAGFFLSFLGIAGYLESESILIILGLAFMIGGVLAPYLSKQEKSIESIAMALLMVGATLFTAGLLYNNGRNEHSAIYIWLFLSIIIMIIAASHLQKFMAIICANLCVLYLLWDFSIPIGFNFLVGINALILTAFWLKETVILEEFKRLAVWSESIVNGCSVSMLIILCFSYTDVIYSYRATYSIYWWISSIFLIALVLWVLNDTLDLIQEKKNKVLVLATVGLALLLLVAAPGIIAGVLLLLLGIYTSYSMFAGKGILAIFIFTTIFYYNMNTTLLLKSLLMVASGLVFLAIGYALYRVQTQAKIEKV